MSKLNLTECTVKQVKENLLKYYTRAIDSGVELRKLDAVFLWSAPGIGKSQMTRQIVGKLEEHLGKPVKYVEIRLGECSIFELLGLMHRNPETNKVIYDAPQIYDVPEGNGYVVYLFDEMDKASRQLQAAALNLVLDKKYWQYQLPENSIVLAAGNPENVDGELFSKFAPELNNRFRHYSIVADYPAWKGFAVENDVNPLVLEFLEANQQQLYSEDAGIERAAFCSPRTWMKVSDYLNMMFEDGNIDWDMAYIDVAGYIGIELAMQLRAFSQNKDLMPSVEDIVSGRCTKVPRRTDIKVAVIKSISTYINYHKGTMTALEWCFAREYVDKFPVEFGVIFYRSIAAMNLQNIMMSYMSAIERNNWKRRYGASLTEIEM